MQQLPDSEQQILEKIRQLPQEKLIEVEAFIDALVKQKQNVLKQSDLKKEIAAMASDPEIQAEITAINAEFIAAEMDGLQDS